MSSHRTMPLSIAIVNIQPPPTVSLHLCLIRLILGHLHPALSPFSRPELLRTQTDADSCLIPGHLNMPHAAVRLQASGAFSAAVTLGLSLAASLANWLVLEPKCTGLMFER